MALGLRESRKSKTMSAWTRMWRLKDRSLIYKLSIMAQVEVKEDHTSSSKRSLLVRYFGLNVDARSSLLVISL